MRPRYNTTQLTHKGEEALTENALGKNLPTTEGKKTTKKNYILEYSKNRLASALEIANKVDTTPSYVWKVLSQARKPSKDIRGRNGRIFAHGKVYYEWAVTRDSFDKLNAPIVNAKTGMKQIGSISKGDPCSCQIHSNGHLIVWSRSSDWRSWLSGQFCLFGWTQELSIFIVDQLKLSVNVMECGTKPIDPSFLPEGLHLETEWGVVIVRDNTPEKGVLELKLSVPNMQKYLGLPDIKKRLEVIEQGSLTHLQSHKTIEALLISLYRSLESKGLLSSKNNLENSTC